LEFVNERKFIKPNDSPEMDIIKQDMPNSISKIEQQTIPRVNGPDGIVLSKSNSVIFGNNSNQNYHTFRHVVDAGLDPQNVESAIRSNIAGNTSTLPSGVPVNVTMTIQNKVITYTAFKLPSGTINIGRIVIH